MKKSSEHIIKRISPVHSVTIDYFAFCGTYPFGMPGHFSLARLAKELSIMNVSMAYVSDIGSFFKKNVVSANKIFLEKCRKFNCKCIRPVPVIDLSMPDFESEICHYIENYNLKAIRIAPNYHGYRLKAKCKRLADILNAYKIMLLIAKEIEDSRFQASCLGVKPLLINDLVPLFEAGFNSKVILNNFQFVEFKDYISDIPDNFYFDSTAFEKGFGELETFVEKHGVNRLVYGSHIPFLYAGAIMHNLHMSLLRVSKVSKIFKGIAGNA